VDLTHQLERYFGYRVFRPGQRAVIESILAGHSALAVFPTGGGKSLCYQLPALILPGLTIVVSPLIALMKDQVDHLEAQNIPAARLDSTLKSETTQELYRKLRNHELKLLYVAPERFTNQSFQRLLSELSISLLAIDEAHCISAWGHNFRPDYLKLKDLSRELNIPSVLCLTATATQRVAQDICEHFQIRKKDRHQLTFYRPNLNLKITPISAEKRKHYLIEKLKQAPQQATIIYTTLQHEAEALAAILKKNQLSARPYHAGLRPEVRSEIQEEFMSGKIPIICATIAFGMGIDKGDIRAVYHFNLPKSLENYSQEIGRAGRDEKSSECELLACLDDLRPLANFTYGDTPPASALRAVLRQILEQRGEFDLSISELSRVYDIRLHVIKTILTYLEMDGYIQPTERFFSLYKVQFTQSKERLLKGFDRGQQDFLSKLFNLGKLGRQWLEINPVEAAEQLQVSRQKVIKTLIELENLGELTLKASQLRHTYQINCPSSDYKEITQSMIQLFDQKEKDNLKRLDQVISYCLGNRCSYQVLLEHFHEEIPPCGHCHYCQNPHQIDSLPSTRPAEITTDDLEVIKNLGSARYPALRTPRQLARFLCGMTSPATSFAWYLPPGERRKRRITSHDAYGLLESHDFHDVLRLCENLIIL